MNMSEKQHYEEGYTFTYTIPDGPKHAWRSLSLTVWLENMANVKGNRYGFMAAIKKFHDIVVDKKIMRYHITNVQSHSVRNEVSPDWIKEEDVVTPMVPLEELKLL